MNNDKFCVLFYMLHHEAGQDKVSALSECYSALFLVVLFCFPKRKPTFKPSFLLFLCVFFLSEAFGESAKSEDLVKAGKLISFCL